MNFDVGLEVEESKMTLRRRSLDVEVVGQPSTSNVRLDVILLVSGKRGRGHMSQHWGNDRGQRTEEYIKM